MSKRKMITLRISEKMAHIIWRQLDDAAYYFEEFCDAGTPAKGDKGAASSMRRIAWDFAERITKAKGKTK